MSGIMLFCALGEFALGCLFAYMVAGSLRPDDTMIGKSQRLARANHDIRSFYWFFSFFAVASSLVFVFLASSF